jgi:hypothetical protein
LRWSACGNSKERSGSASSFTGGSYSYTEARSGENNNVDIFQPTDISGML